MFALPIKKHSLDKLKRGYPWIFENAIDTHSYPPSGELVYMIDKQRRPFGIAYFNANSKLMGRVLSMNPKDKIDESFFYHRFVAAKQKRDKIFSVPYYRLVHAEGDLLPGLIIDRFNDTLVIQVSTLGMEKLKPVWLPALKLSLSPQNIIFRNDIPVREQEGLISQESSSDELILPVIENNVCFVASLSTGQKTGWFYDQRANRKWVAQQSKDKTVLDLYTYSGGFGITAAVYGARNVTMVDSSEQSLHLASLAAQKNMVETKSHFVRAKVFEYLEDLIAQSKTFELVVVDPPAFIKNAKDIPAGLKGYEKLARLATKVVAPNGTIFMASCSHHAQVSDFKNSILKGIEKANRHATLCYKGGADKDHPIHPLLPENHYLKAFAFQLD